jgi:hypothetical protein
MYHMLTSIQAVASSENEMDPHESLYLHYGDLLESDGHDLSHHVYLCQSDLFQGI